MLQARLELVALIWAPWLTMYQGSETSEIIYKES